MGKLIDFLSGTKILEEAESPMNGKITVIQSLAFGTYIQVGGLTQSGGIIHDVWKKPLKIVQRTKRKAQRCLILGLGGGTVVKLIKRLWPNAKVVGVDIDPVMVELGKKHLGLGEYDLKVVIGDAYEYLNQRYESKSKKFNLVLLDLYVGDEFPSKFESEDFVNLVKKSLSKGGVAVFNRLYYGEKRAQSMKFGEKLEGSFKKVDIVFPEANVMFICYI